MYRKKKRVRFTKKYKCVCELRGVDLKILTVARNMRKRKINSVIDLGSGYGRVTNFLSDHTNSKITGFELNMEVYNKSLKLSSRK